MTLGIDRTFIELDQAIDAAIKGEIVELKPQGGARLLPAPETDSQSVATNIMELLQRVVGTSVEDVDQLINEVQTLREILQEQGARVQRELAEYARVSQLAMESTSIIAARLAHWKKVGDWSPYSASH
jgi:cell division septum initiation protein DivIVA